MEKWQHRADDDDQHNNVNFWNKMVMSGRQLQFSDLEGNVTDESDFHPLFNTRVCGVIFPGRVVQQSSPDLIAESIYNQSIENGFCTNI